MVSTEVCDKHLKQLHLQHCSTYKVMLELINNLSSNMAKYASDINPPYSIVQQVLNVYVDNI